MSHANENKTFASSRHPFARFSSRNYKVLEKPIKHDVPKFVCIFFF